MNCKLRIEDGRGNVLTPCQVQERVIDRLRAENQKLRQRCSTLQRMIDWFRAAEVRSRPMTRRERALHEADRIFR